MKVDYQDYKDALTRLCEYEDAEETGLLVRLPCKVGDIAYVVGAGRVRKISVLAYVVRGNGIAVEVQEHRPACVSGYFVPLQSIYRTRAEAKAALKGEKR